jgi:hypothetical protein
MFLIFKITEEARKHKPQWFKILNTVRKTFISVPMRRTRFSLHLLSSKAQLKQLSLCHMHDS